MLGLELDAGHHRRIDVAAAPVAHCRFQRFDPALVAHIAVLARADLGEQGLRPHLEIEAGVLHQTLGVELRDHVVGNRARSQGHRDAARVRLLDEARQLQEAVAFLARVGQRATHQVDVADLGLVDHRVQRLAHPIERGRRNLDLAGLLAQVQRALVGCTVGAEAAAHRNAVVLVQKVFATRRDIDHQHVAVRRHAGLREGQAVRGLLRQPGAQWLELDRDAAAAAVVDQDIALLGVAFDVPRRVAVTEDADLGAIGRVDEVGDGRDATAGGVVLAFLESVGVVVGHRVPRRLPERRCVPDPLAHHLTLQCRRSGELDHGFCLSFVSGEHRPAMGSSAVALRSCHAPIGPRS